jgi:arabinose-5-phosphate isomerase
MTPNVTTFLETLAAAIAGLDAPGLQRELGAAAAALAAADHVWCTGIGKSARAASLLAEDLATLTLAASFVHGGDLLHGGMGRIEARHCLVLFSDGGKTRELAEASRALGDPAAHRRRKPGTPRSPASAAGPTRILITASATPGIVADLVVRYAAQPDGPYPLPGATVAQVVLGRLLAFAAAESAQIAPAALAWAHPA